MQYKSDLNREQLVELATKTYFGNVDAKNLEETLACFHDTALFTIQTEHTVHEGKEGIRRMFETFFDSYEKIVHKDFECTVDEKNGRIAASFNAVLVDAEGNETVLRNTNFWRIRGSKFQEVYVYMSGPNVLV
ncbi:MAG: nuclear transport factor 2 family protein [Alphaproteobacteria bacterium]|nr:MAG: nuclear transport factor 2 family protein [Alphaproteobacteria bacterium]